MRACGLAFVPPATAGLEEAARAERGFSARAAALVATRSEDRLVKAASAVAAASEEVASEPGLAEAEDVAAVLALAAVGAPPDAAPRGWRSKALAASAGTAATAHSGARLARRVSAASAEPRWATWPGTAMRVQLRLARNFAAAMRPAELAAIAPGEALARA